MISRDLLPARLLLLFTVTIWGWTFVATKVALDHITAVELMGLRFLVAIPAMVLLMVARGTAIRVERRGRVLLGSLLLGLHFFVQITGLRFTSAVNTGWLIAISPLCIAVLAFLVLKEPIRRGTVVGIVVATAGIVLLVSRGEMGRLAGMKSLGDWLIVVSANTWALYTIATRNLSRTGDPLAVAFQILLPVALVLLAIMGLSTDWSRLLHLPPDAVVAVLFLGICGTALGQWFWQLAIARVGVVEAGVFLYLEPLATTALAVPYLGEPLGVATICGGLLVLAGVRCAQTPRAVK